MSGERGADRSRRPGAGEHHHFYSTYVDAVPDGDVVETLERHGAELAARLRAVPPDRERHRYAEGKWSVREVVGHVVDSERVFQGRIVHIARGDPAPLPDMDETLWAESSNAQDRPLSELVDELEAVRRSTVALLRGLPAAGWGRRGLASGREITVRALAWIAAGHAIHHEGVLRERYGVDDSPATS